MRWPEPGTTVVVLGDLGCLDGDGVRARESWIERGRRYREHGNRPVALVPCDPASVPEELTRDWTIIPWEGTVASGKAALSPDEAGRGGRTDPHAALVRAARGTVADPRGPPAAARRPPGCRHRIAGLAGRGVPEPAFRGGVVPAGSGPGTPSKDRGSAGGAAPQGLRARPAIAPGHLSRCLVRGAPRPGSRGRGGRADRG